MDKQKEIEEMAEVICISKIRPNCEICEYNNGCISQVKAKEIYNKVVKQAKEQAVKEAFEKLKEKAEDCYRQFGVFDEVDFTSILDKTLKEVIGEKECERSKDCYEWRLKEASRYYEQGIRKIDKDSVVLTREEWKQIKNSLYYSKEALEKKLQKASKETAEKILNELYVQFSADYLVGLRNEYKDWKYADLIKRYAKSVGVEIKE